MHPIDEASADGLALTIGGAGARRGGARVRRTSRRYEARTAAWRTTNGPRVVLYLARGAFALGLGTAILFQGAVTAVPLTSASVLVGTAGFLASFGKVPNGAQRGAIASAIIVACLVASYAALQVMPLPPQSFANAIWTEVGQLVDSTTRTISVDPSLTRQAVLSVLLPIAVYAVGLALFPSDAAAFNLLRMLAVLGVAFAGFGLVQTLWLPGSLLLVSKTAYVGSLTSVFVNRNTAGTFLGVAALVCLTLLIRPVRTLPGVASLGSVFTSVNVPSHAKIEVALVGVSTVLILLSIALTHSRGALLACVVALALVLPLLVLDGDGTGRRRGKTRSLARRILTFGWIGLGLLLASLVVGSQTVLRAGILGVDDVRLCLYEATWVAFQDNWRLGTGLGTFASVFPAFRTDGCGLAYSAFQRAHNFYLEGLLTIGIVFVPLALFVYGHVLRNLWLGQKTRRSLRFVPLIAFGAVLLVSLHSLTDFSLQIPAMSAYFAAYLAAATTISLGRTKRRLDPR